nr:amidohydrolase [uncultured Chitinophaga sp.]
MRKTPFSLLLSLLTLLLFARCQDNTDIADRILKGQVRTMDDKDPLKLEECVAIKDGKIIFVGAFDQAKLKHFKEGITQVTEYGDSALIMPAFIDAHAHVGLYMMLHSMADLAARPYGNVNDSVTLEQTMKAYLDSLRLPDNNTTTVILGNNYDDAQLAGNQQPTRYLLDRVSTTHPIYIMHVSGHMGVANTKLLTMMGITNSTPPNDITGGTIVKDAKGVLTGLLLENANVKALNTAMALNQGSDTTAAAKKAMLEELVSHLLQAEETWFRYGITTICEGRADPNTISLIKGANDKGLLTGDFIVLPDYDMNHNLGELAKYYPNYDKHFKIGAVKLTFDGSPQGRDAFLSQPYMNPPVGESKNYKGHPIYQYDDALRKIDSVARNLKMPVHVHCNGDSAIDMVLRIFKTLKERKILDNHPTPNVIIHSQITRPDQLDSMKTLAGPVMESFFPTHVYLWGDWYVKQVLGMPRAQRIAPLQEAAQKGLRYTIHTDSPVTPPDLLTAVHAAVNRLTLDGILLGPDQRVSVYDALKAITTEAAFQWGEEKTKGKLLTTYKADIVVLSHDPVKVKPETIRDAVQVVSTFKDGQQVFPIGPDKKRLTQH